MAADCRSEVSWRVAANKPNETATPDATMIFLFFQVLVRRRNHCCGFELLVFTMCVRLEQVIKIKPGRCEHSCYAPKAEDECQPGLWRGFDQLA